MTASLRAPHNVAELQQCLEAATAILPVVSYFWGEMQGSPERSMCYEGVGPLAEAVTGMLRVLACAKPGGWIRPC